MRRFMTALALAAACTLGVSTAFAGGPGCSGSEKTAKTADAGKSCSKSASSCCSTSEFPTMVRMVGDKAVGCPMTAEKMAKDGNTKVVFAVAGDKFDTEPAAWDALANASERYVKMYTAVSCVVDGKTYFVCDDSGKCCSSTKTASASGCSKGEAKTVSAGGCDKSKSDVKVVKADDKAEAKSCTKGETKTVSAGGCDKSKADAKLAKADAKGCCASKAKAAMAKADGCCESKGEKFAVIDSKACAELCKNAKDVKYVLAGREYKSFDEANKARTELVAAVKAVKMKYLVEGKEVDCSSKICPSAKEAGKVKYVVGEKELGCELMARVELAKAQYDAAKQTVEKQLAKM